MPPRELSCPVCDADLLLAGDERPGDVVHCTFCSAPFVLQKSAKGDDDEALWEVEEDF